MRKFPMTLVLLLGALLLAEGCTPFTGRDSGFSPSVRTTWMLFGSTTNIAVMNGTVYRMNIYRYGSTETVVGTLDPLSAASIRYYRPFVSRRQQNMVRLIAIAFDPGGHPVGYAISRRIRLSNRYGVETPVWEIHRLEPPSKLRQRYR